MEKIFLARPFDIQSIKIKKGFFRDTLIVYFIGGAVTEIRGNSESVRDMFENLSNFLKQQPPPQPQQEIVNNQQKVEENGSEKGSNN